MNRKTEKSLIVGLDIGTSKTVAIVGEFQHGDPVEIIGVGEPLRFNRDANGLNVSLPAQKVGNYVYGFKINGRGLTTAAG